MKYLSIERGSLFVLLTALCLLAGCTGTPSNAPANTGPTPATVVKDASAPPSTDVAKPAMFPPIRAGLASAEFELLDGAKFKIADKKGKVLLVNIWGIWCGPCRAEMPHLVELQNQYRDQDFEVIGLNIGDQNGGDENVDAIKKFAGDMKLNYTLARADDAATAQFHQQTRAQVVPQTLLIDREGNLRGVFVGGGGNVINSMKQAVAKAVNGKAA